MKALISVALTFLFSLAVLAANPIQLTVEGMTCSSCEKSVENACMSVPGVKSAKADHKTGKVVVTTDGKHEVSKEALTSALEKTEYKVKSQN